MEKSTTIQEIIQRLDKLTPVQQKQILNSVEDLEIMKQAIEEGCGMASLS